MLARERGPAACARTTEDDNGVSACTVGRLVPEATVPAGTADRKVAQAVVNKNATTTRKALDEEGEYKRR